MKKLKAPFLGVVLSALIGCTETPTQPLDAGLSTHRVGGSAGFTINPTGTVNMPGGTVITMSGTFTCTAGEEVFISARAFERRKGRRLKSAFGNHFPRPDACTGSVQTWTAILFSAEGFHPGPHNVSASIDVRSIPCCAHRDFDTIGATIQLEKV